jgi:hypothetical protein
MDLSFQTGLGDKKILLLLIRFYLGKGAKTQLTEIVNDDEG